MRNFKIILLMVFLLEGIALQAKTKIQVHFPGSQNHKAFLWTYDDFISYKQQLVGSTISDSKGNFTFLLNNKAITYVIIQVEFFKIKIYVEPHKDYEIMVDAVDMKNRDFYPKDIIGYLTPNYRITQPATNDINAELEEVNDAFAKFIDTNYVFLYQSRLPKETLAKFILNIDSLRRKSSTDYVKKHIDIQMVQLNLLLRKTGTSFIVQQYFKGDNILYHDKIYMDFFNSFWSQYLLVSIHGLRYGQLDSVINKEKSYSALTRLIENDIYLKDSVLRELVILRNLKEIYSNWRFSKAAIQDILSDISAKGLTAENRRIAVNIRKELLKYDKNKAPDFLLPSIDGSENYSLKSFENKYIYINIWNEKSSKCLAEMDYEKELFLDLDDIIYFVSVYVGPDTAAARKLIEKRGYKWTQLYYNEDFEFLKNYKMDIFPYYILLGKTGNIEWYPAKLPSEGFNDYFIEMLNAKKGNLR